MLANIVEGDKKVSIHLIENLFKAIFKFVNLIIQKCDQYWPDNQKEAKKYGELTVKLDKVIHEKDYVIRILKIKDVN